MLFIILCYVIVRVITLLYVVDVVVVTNVSPVLLLPSSSPRPALKRRRITTTTMVTPQGKSRLCWWRRRPLLMNLPAHPPAEPWSLLVSVVFVFVVILLPKRPSRSWLSVTSKKSCALPFFRVRVRVVVILRRNAAALFVLPVLISNE